MIGRVSYEEFFVIILSNSMSIIIAVTKLDNIFNYNPFISFLLLLLFMTAVYYAFKVVIHAGKKIYRIVLNRFLNK